MKANELMVGDWVFYRKPIQVTANIIMDALIYPKRYKPLPITPDILKRNKWFMEQDADDSPECWVYGNKYILITGTREMKEKVVVIDNIINEKRNIYITCKIKFVHELQHAMKLCSINKKIEL